MSTVLQQGRSILVDQGRTRFFATKLFFFRLFSTTFVQPFHAVDMPAFIT